MNTIRYIIWFVLVVVWFAALSALQYPIRKRCNNIVRILIILAKLIIGSIIAYFIMAVDSDLAYHSGFVLAALYVVLLADAAGDVISLLIILIRKDDRNPNRIQITVCAICTAIFLAFGTVNMQTVTANRFTYTSDKLTRDYRVVFLSDLHVGSSQSMNTVESTIRRIDEEDADLVLLGGDIVDEYTTKEEMEETFSLSGEIKAPVYFVFGNHDRQPTSEAVGGRTFSDEDHINAASSNGITILQDEWVAFSDDLVVLGREAYNCDERMAVGDIPARPDGAFVLTVDHSPYLTEEIIKSNADLQLSGHTHAGQLFPIKYGISMIGNDSYGFYRHGNTDVYVSSGAGGWLFPIRTNENCHYEVVTLQPAG